MYAFQYIQNNFIAEILAIQDTRLRGNIQLIISSIPIVTLLWFFRTHDTREAIEKSQENISMSLLTKGMDMITDKESSKQRLGLIILAKLKQDNIKNQHLATIIDNTTRDINFSGADLSFTDLTHINLSKNGLGDTDLVNTNLTGAYLVEAYLSGANLSGANLNGADLTGANLSKTDLTKTDLTNTTLCRANLEGAKLEVANLQFANLEGVDLTKTNLSEKDLEYLDKRI